MLVVILTVLFVLVVVVAFALSVGVFATGVGGVVARKVRDAQINASLPPGVRMKRETPKEYLERERRKRYLESLVDRE